MHPEAQKHEAWQPLYSACPCECVTERSAFTESSLQSGRMAGRRLTAGCVGGLQVLTTGSWPTQSSAKCNLPRELERGCEDFKAFYLASHSGRKLSWQTNMGNTGALALGACQASSCDPVQVPVNQNCGLHSCARQSCALICWQHSLLGPLCPGSFISSAESVCDAWSASRAVGAPELH